MEKELRQLFKNRADAYLNTIDESVEQGMSEDMFIKTMEEALAISRVVGRSEQFSMPHEFTERDNYSGQCSICGKGKLFH